MTQSQQLIDCNLSVNNFSKKFCKNLRRSMLYGITDIVKSSFGIRPDTTRIRKDEFWAVDNISFKCGKGDILGIIGANGSGKTTLLRMLAGIFPPDKGNAELTGRVSAILSPGAGFHPHMTVRENIYVNGTILGMTRLEIDEKFDFIIAFSGIKDFINAPVAALSTGMHVRLGFSIALAVKSDIFLIDEILSIGDSRFREKSIAELKKISQESTILFVSHNMEMIRSICNRIIVLHKGRMVHEGSDVAGGIEYYYSIAR